MMKTEFVIFTWPWNEEIGGVMVLHVLANRLNLLGYSAAVWPAWKPVRFPRCWSELRQWLAYLLKGRFLGFDTGPFSTPVATLRNLRAATVVYPEITTGNPLGVERVARWLLHKPGYHTGVVDFGPRELFFFYNAAFRNPLVPRGEDRQLRVTFRIPDYQNNNHGQRSGACVLLRKGAGRADPAELEGKLLVDDLTHRERAEVFNQSQFCLCYDLYTFTAVYSALCGCVPVIVPVEGLSEEEWEPDVRNRLGLAYGWDKVDWAKATLGGLRSRLDDLRHEEDSQVREFVNACRRRFGTVISP